MKKASKSPKQRDENAKNKKWQTPMDLPHATPSEYPQRHEQANITKKGK